MRIGIDSGGTFTDFIGVDGASNDLIIGKFPSSAQDPIKSIVGVIRESGLDIGRAASIVLGTAGAFESPTIAALLPQITPPGSLQRATAISSGSRSGSTSTCGAAVEKFVGSAQFELHGNSREGLD